MTGTQPASPTILYVEDNASNQRLMASVMGTRPGVRLIVRGLGFDAVEAAVTERPALILLDRRLPDMSGAEVLERLRARPETKHTPVIIVSGDTARPDAHEASFGVTAYITKPYEVPDLLAHIDRVLDPHPH